jgi:osmotically-inducible protein OsmY
MRARQTANAPRTPGLMLRACLWCLVSCSISLLVNPPVRGGEPPGEQPIFVPPLQPDLRDVRLTLMARKALREDRELGRLNLGVSVRQGVATLRGRVPSEALAWRAIQLVKPIQGIFEVYHDLQIKEFDPVDLPVLGGPIASGPEEGNPPTRSPGPSGILAGRPGGNPTGAHAMEPGAPGPLNEAVSLGRPVIRPASSSEAGQSPKAVLMAPQPSDAAISVEASVTGVLTADHRFSRVRPEVQEGVVYLRGSVTRQEEVMELARLVARLSGVARVVVDNVRLDPRERQAGQPPR